MVKQTRVRVIVAGGRDFRDKEWLYRQLDQHFTKFGDDELEIVHGGAKEGADKYADDYAKECGIQFKVFDADWTRFGDSAGPRRNKEMAQYGHALIAFWDGKSRGTLSMINQAKKYNLLHKVYYYSNKNQQYLEQLIEHGMTEEEDQAMSDVMDDIFQQ